MMKSKYLFEGGLAMTHEEAVNKWCHSRGDRGCNYFCRGDMCMAWVGDDEEGHCGLVFGEAAEKVLTGIAEAVWHIS